MNVASLAEREVAEHGSYVKLLFEGRSYTNTELLESARRLSGSLQKLGVDPGDRVVVMMSNCPEVPVTFGATLRLGAVVVPVLFLLAEEEVAHILKDSGAKVAITTPEFLPKLQAASAGLDNPPIQVCHGDAPEGADVKILDELIAQGHETEMVEREANDLAVLSYTSGTTGVPKGVMISHGNALFNAKASAGAADVRDGDISVQCLPLAHSFGIGVMLTGNLFKASGVMLRWFSAEGFFAAVRDQRITNGTVVPTMLSFLLADPAFDSIDWSSLRWLVSGGAPLPLEVAEEFERRSGVKILQGYGLTETSPTISVMSPDGPHKPGSCGQPVAGCDVRIVSDDGTDVPTGEPGEVVCRGPNVMLGYKDLPDKTAEVLKNGWFYTGDIGHMDQDGYLYITDRKKDLIIRGGLNIVPRDIEEVLYEHPAVTQAAVVGGKHASMGEEVVAFVAVAPGVDVTEAELIELCQTKLAKYKTPRAVVLKEALPINGIGKLLRRELRDEATKVIAETVAHE